MSEHTSPTAGDEMEPQSESKVVGSPTRVHRVSAWPPFIALGFAVGEIGIVLNLVPLSIGGLILFGGSVAGILEETDYVQSRWWPLLIMGTIFVGFGGVMWGSQVSTVAIETLLAAAETNTIAVRGEAIVIAGAILVLGAVASGILKPLQRRF
ncbi:MAG: cox cluster protein [Halodesulfurarchaeum sp.]|nr:cox cluster protein [Halodesulfurarchaeum sp.]